MTPQATFMNAMGWTLVHFVWQGALIAVVLAVALLCLRGAGSRIRYVVSCAAMVAMVICAGLTFLNLAVNGNTAEISVSSVAVMTGHPVAIQPQVPVERTGADFAADYLPLLVWMWCLGVFALSVRSLGGWMVAQRFARLHTCPAERMWESRFTALRTRLAITQPVKLAVSTCAQVPAVVGWIKPIVLVPAAAFAGLAPEQIEALLAHELAHVRRHDYLVNLLQTAAETLLFYHPGVWWVSRQIRDERENCCDDLAVEACGDPITYVRALTQLEQIRGATPHLAMAADGGSLLTRVRRLLPPAGEPAAHTPGRTAPAWLIGITVVGALVLAGVATNGLAQLSDAPRGDKLTAEEKRETAGWLAEMEAAGYRNLDIDELIRLKDHGVDGSYARRLQEQGLKLDADELVRFRDHGVEPEFVSELQKTGIKDLEADQIIRLSEHGVDPKFIRDLQGSIQGIEMDVDDVIRLSEHGVHSDWIQKIEDAGYKDASVDTLIRLNEHGITVEMIRELQKSGLADLDADEVIRLSEHGVQPDWIRAMQAAGLRDSSADVMIRLNEHGVSVEQVNGLKQIGLGNLDADGIVRLREHGVRSEWIRQIQAAGFAKASVDELIRLSEHGVTAGMINDAVKQGFKDLNIDQLIRLSEHGVLNQ